MLERIDKDLVPIKAHYFLFNAATGPIVPFLPTIGKQLGFNEFQVGTMYTIIPLTGLIAKPLFGALADKTQLHKVFFLSFQVILAIAFFTMNFIPPLEKEATVTLTCKKLAFLEICPEANTKGFSDEVLHSVLYQREDRSPNSSCSLVCEGSSLAYNELCKNWQAEEYCTLAGTNISKAVDAIKEFAFTAGFNMYKDLTDGACVEIRLMNAVFSDGVIHKPWCEKLLRTKCRIKCHNDAIMNRLLEEVDNIEPSKRDSSFQFHWFLWAAVISWVGMTVVVSIADTLCLNILGEERRREYGKQKMWGTIGFGIFGLSVGYLVDVFSKGQAEKDYSCIFYIMLITMVFDIIVSATLRKNNPGNVESEPSVWWELWSIAKEGRVLVFIWWCIGAGICTGVVWNFLFWYTEDLATTSQKVWIKTLQGLLTGVQCFLGEMPFNFLSGSVLRKLGHINVMSLVLLVYAVRFMAYSLVTNVWIFLLIEVLHGPSMGLCLPTMVSYGDKVAPSGTKATMQGFVGGIFEGIGVSIGSLLCGWLMDTYKGVVTFRIFSVGALLWLTIYWIMQLILRKVKAYPLHQGHSHLASYATPDDAILMTMSQELQTY